MLMTHAQAQGLDTEELHRHAVRVLAMLSDEQLLEMIAYAHALMGDTPHPAHALEDLVEERH
jgi:hypothetical protein